MTLSRLALAAMLIAVLCGCSSPAHNASISTTDHAAVEEFDRLAANPTTVTRPIVMLCGFRAPGFIAGGLRSDLIAATSGRREDVLVVDYPLTGDLDRAAREAVDAVNRKWPSPRPRETIEVDVIGLSMGGLVARWAALSPGQRTAAMQSLSRDPGKDRPRLNVIRMFTFSTPHRGASLAHIGLSTAAGDMKPGSPFLQALDAADAARPYELVCYAHLNDSMVGATRAAPPGMAPIWTNGTVLFSHHRTQRDPVLVADLARRLRGEPPLAEPGEPPPRD